VSHALDNMIKNQFSAAHIPVMDFETKRQLSEFFKTKD
jgi:hypothetical protein